MRLSAALVVLPLTALAHTLPNYRRYHVRDAVEAARAGFVDRAGAPIDNATEASISAERAGDAASSTTTSASSSATSSAVSSTTTSSSSTTSLTSSITDTSSSSTTSSTTTTSTTTTSSTPTTTSTTIIDDTPTTISQITTSATSSTTSTSLTKTITSVTRTTASASKSASSGADSSSSTKSGLSKGALVGIIVAAAVVGLVAIGWTAFRKWKLKPSNRFDSKMKPIDFSPQNGMGGEDFFEKTLQRTASHADADRQRQQLVSELDHTRGVEGIPEHDFTAGVAGHGATGIYDQNMYNQDPYSHAEQYDYDAAYYQQQQPQHEHDYPPHAHQQAYDYPTQDQPVDNSAGYADLQRGPSVGSGSGHGHAMTSQTMAFPEPQLPGGSYGLGRPTGGSDGPYAQAAQYRGY